MKKKAVLTTLRVVLSILFVLALIGSLLCACVFRMFDANALEKQLQKQEFYNFAMQEIESNITDLQGIIGADTADILAAIPAEQVTPLLKDYTRKISENLLHGTEQTADIAFTSDTLYQLVYEIITPEQYAGNTTAMEEDRNAAYADLTDAVKDTLAFFPQTLYGSFAEIMEGAGLRLSSVYGTINTVRKLTLPLLLLTLLLAVGSFLCGKENAPRSLRTVAGCTFITGSVFFLLTLFLRSYPLLDRLSLSDGLLRRYILAVMGNIGNSIFLVVTVAFVSGLLLLIGSIVWETCISTKNTCKASESVV